MRCGSGGLLRLALGRAAVRARAVPVGGVRRGVLGRLWSRLAGPVLVELHPPLALVVLLELQLGPEGAARAALEARDRLRRLARRHQLLDHGDRQDLARLALPDHEAAARILLRPAGVALAVLDHVAAADRTGAQVGPLDLH